MTKETREIFINAIEAFNKKQADEENKIDVYEAFDSLDTLTDEEIEEKINVLLQQAQ